VKFDILDDNNFLMYAMKHYENPQCEGIEEFYDDLNRIKYLKRLFRRFKSSGNFRERLILNHIIILGNVYGIVPTVRMMFFKLEKELHPMIKTCLVFLNMLPEQDIPEVDLVSIPLDNDVIKLLREV